MEEGDCEEDKLIVGAFHSRITSCGTCKKKGSQEVHRFYVRFAERIVRMKRRRTRFRSTKALIANTHRTVCPRTTTDLFTADQRTAVATVEAIPRRLQNDTITKRVCSISFRDLYSHVLKVHNIDPQNPPRRWRQIDLLSDGASFTKSGSWQQHLVFVAFPPCTQPYPLFIHSFNKNRGGEVDVYDLLNPVVKFLQEDPQIELRRTIGDSKERKEIKGLMPTNAYFSCEICLRPGEHVLDDPKRRVSFPVRDETFPRRTTERMKATMMRQNLRYIQAGEPRNFRWENILGYKKWSPLLDLPNYDMIASGPLDQMHCAYLGLCKKFYRIALTEGPDKDKFNRQKNQVRKTAIKKINNWIKSSKIPSELGRRTREIDYANYKATEWRFVMLFGFAHVATSDLSAGIDIRIKQIMLLYDFLLRALNLDTEKFQELRQVANLRELFRLLQEKYEEVFGGGEATFNEHCLFEHGLDTVICHGPLNEYSAWKMENSFGRLKRCFHPGTPNEEKQIFQSFYADDFYFHLCPHLKRIRYSPRPTDKVDDSLIRVGEQLLRITSLESQDEDEDNEDNEEDLICKRINHVPFYTDGLGLDLPWSQVRVWKMEEDDAEEEEEEEVVRVRRADVSGKLVVTGNLVSDCSKQLIYETS